MKYFNLLTFCFCVFVVPLQPGWAQIGDDIPGSSDHPAISRFTDSQIILYDTSSNENYQLILGNLRRVAGLTVPESVERLRGNVTRITYEVSQSFTGTNVFEFFVDQARQRGYTQLFSCSGRDCGSSNYWANTVFENRILYGPERNQFFMALETVDSPVSKAYLSIYIITRGNRRLYAYIEVVEVAGSGETDSPPLNLNVLQESGSLVIEGLDFDDQDRIGLDSGIDELARLLQANPTIRLYVVGHMGGGGPETGAGALNDLTVRSLSRANQVRERLINQGIDPDRLSAQGVGPLAPGCAADECLNRIEVVLQ